MRLKLREYQTRAIGFCLEKRKAYLAMDVGLGKTAVALATIATTKRPTLVIAPLSVIHNTWPEEINKWAPWLSYEILHGYNKQKRMRLKKDIYLLNYDGLKWYYKELLKGRVKQMNLILDEITFVKDPRTKRFKYLKAMLPMFPDIRLGLSGTPDSEDDLTQLWSQYYILDSGASLFTTFGRYTKKYFMYDAYTMKHYVHKHARKLIYNRISPITFRLDRDDYLDLPPIIYNAMRVELPSSLKEKYDKFETEFVTAVENGTVTAFNAASLSSKLRQFVQGALYTENETEFIHEVKVNKLAELLESGNNILCPIQFRFEYEMLRKKFNDPPIIYGKTSSKQARSYIDQWNKGQLPLLLVHPQSISHGVNLQQGGHTVVWLGLPWSFGQFYQMNGRLHRTGQQKGVIVNAVIMKDTIDELVWKTLKRKEKGLEHLLTALKEKHHDKRTIKTVTRRTIHQNLAAISTP